MFTRKRGKKVTGVPIWGSGDDAVADTVNPSFAKEGWLRHKRKWPHSLEAQTGWLFQATD